MITVKDFKDKLKGDNEAYNLIIDNWLKEKVLPRFTHNGQRFPQPEGVPLKNCHKLLSYRGFSVNEEQDDLGRYYLCITIPPQQE
tara:strand:- start:793 stop:1047 length:255 start_codon:yes stop_codon:yes gene_type:complete